MAQIPALFLPKKNEEKPQVKKQEKKRKKPPVNKKVSALLKGRIDGYKKNTGQIRSGTLAG